MSTPETTRLDPVTFEVLKNAFGTVADEMGEQILRTCYSFVLFSKDFATAICDRHGNTIGQGSQDIPVMVGTMHFTCKAVIDFFGEDIHPGDVFIVNDPFRGGTHHNDVRIVRPVFADDELIAFAQSCGHWSDIGGSVPGSYDLNCRDYFGLGLRFPPLRIVERGVWRRDLTEFIYANIRVPEETAGDLAAQTEATAVGERELLRLCDRYGVDVVTAAMEEVQNYTERFTRKRLADLPEGTWETADYLDSDPESGEGLVPIRVKLTLENGEIHYDLTGSHPGLGNLFNIAFGAAFSSCVSATKLFFPDIPLNSGFHRVIKLDAGPEGTLVNATPPQGVTALFAPVDKIMSAVIELWSRVMPERAMATSVSIDHLLIGGQDTRGEDSHYYVLYDWFGGGWGGRADRDGVSATSAPFAACVVNQMAEGQERLCPVIVDEFVLQTDSAGPGEFRGGLGVTKAGELLEAEDTVLSYFVDRVRSVVWGIEGGLPSRPQGLTIDRGEGAEFVGASVSDVLVSAGTRFSRASAGGGGYGDPLSRAPERVLEDVIDGYVSVERAQVDYGVVIEARDPEVDDFRIDMDATAIARAQIAAERVGWLREDAESVAERYRAGELTALDLVRRYGVIVDWKTGELFSETTRVFRERMTERSAAHWCEPSHHVVG